MSKLKKQRHVMVDIETLDTAESTIIPTVAAACFYFQEDGQLLYDGKVKTWILDVEDQDRMGRTVSINTIMWWMNLDYDIRSTSFSKEHVRMPVEDFLVEFGSFVNTCPLWGNCCGFDCNKIRSLYETYTGDPQSGPKFWKDRSFRTIKDMLDPYRELKPKNEAAHDPAADVVAQIEWLQAIAEKHPGVFAF